MQPKPNFRNRTYARRESRITQAQQRALAELSHRYVVHRGESEIKLSELLPGADRYAVEIGFGDGDALVELAADNPTTGYVGIEVYRPGIGKCLMSLDRRGLDNVRICARDARDVLRDCRPRASLAAIYVLFPDPWPKKRHHKRRLMNPEFVDLCADCLQAAGRIYFSTDWPDYAQAALRHLESNDRIDNVAGSDRFYTGERLRPQTRYELKALARGDRIYDLVFERRVR
ncbi:MAG: tRNA (guanosine(46)-N7)-methyltransferase TrmB [Acidiferrobacterales bacterium]|nr:tRNA (guanosine(46)-N7)-methyltransferase TrmB [Acidiferrobacterales bacterium]